MADMYCQNCQRMVGTKKNVALELLIMIIGVILAFMFPIIGWLVGVIMVILGIVMIAFSGKKCPLCGSKSLRRSAPQDGD